MRMLFAVAMVSALVSVADAQSPDRLSGLRSPSPSRSPAAAMQMRTLTNRDGKHCLDNVVRTAAPEEFKIMPDGAHITVDGIKHVVPLTTSVTEPPAMGNSASVWMTRDNKIQCYFDGVKP